MDNKACTTCLYEYPCNWSPSRDKPCCENWKPEDTSPKKRGSRQGLLPPGRENMEEKIEIKTSTEQRLLGDLEKAEEENKVLRSCLDSVSAWEKKRAEHSLKIAHQTVERDSKPVANIILNMSYDFHTHVSFCDIFKLKEKTGCEEKYCTNCIHNFLKEYFNSQN